MNLKEINILFQKELQLEWRSRYAINGILLYLVGSIYVCYLSFQVKAGSLSPTTWNTLFWIIMLFSAINAVAKSFLTENNKRVLYYYTLVSPESVIVSKILVNILILVSMAVVGIFIYTIVMGNPIQDLGFYIVILISGAMSLAIGVTLVSAIAAQGSNNTSLMAILSFPILLPILLYTIKLSKAALDGLDRTLSMDELLILWAFNVIAAVLSYILYPFLWKE